MPDAYAKALALVAAPERPEAIVATNDWTARERS